MSRSKRTKQKNTRQPQIRGLIRLPDWWQKIAHRLDWAGHLAERWEPSFHTGWLALTAVAFPLLLILLAFLLTSFR
ncbi:MAG: hypothetical protein KF753_02200 [Caldilineaceae bacterium]|nr:hypothetical protein [Caldilineaceae bacterium]